MLNLYRLLIYLLLPLVIGRLLVRSFRERRYFSSLPQRFGFRQLPPHAARIWVHAVSVGEVNAATALVEQLLAKYPEHSIMVTTMTVTGAERVQQVFSGKVEHCYLPLDYPGAVRRFFEQTTPCLAIVMETEIWFNLIDACHRRRIPIAYVNVRLSQQSYRGYRRIRKLVQPTLAKIDVFAVQSEPEARRLSRLGARTSTIMVVGNLKFDITVKPETTTAAQMLRAQWGQRLVWVAGSTHEGEEAIILDAFELIQRQIESLLLVIVPRHPQRFAAVANLCAARYRTAVRSQIDGVLSEDTAVYVADTMGELSMLIAAGDVAFIGGSLVPVGGHNVLEAVAVGVPVVFGPHMFNFEAIADLVLKHGAGVQVMNGSELTGVVTRMLSDAVLRKRYGKCGTKLIEQNRGALETVVRLIDDLLTD